MSDRGRGNQSVGSPLPPGPVDTGGRSSLLVGLAALAMALLFFPLAIVLGVAAIVVGVRAERRVQRTRGRAPGAVAGVIAGAIALVLGITAATLLLIFYPEFSSYIDCRSGANTRIAKQACEDELRNDLKNRF